MDLYLWTDGRSNIVKHWREIYKEKLMEPSDAAALIECGDRIFAGSSGCIAGALLDAVAMRPELRDVLVLTAMNDTVCCCLTSPEYAERMEYHTLFVYSADRKMQKTGRVHMNSVQLHRAARAATETYGVNTLMLQVSEPDENGYLYYGSMGTAWGVLDERVEKLIFQINSNQQKVRGVHNRIHVSRVTALCKADTPMPIYPNKEPDNRDRRIAAHIVPYIHSGDMLQVGIGGVPNAIAYSLEGHKNLGIYTEVLTESLIFLMKCGAVDLNRVTASFSLSERGMIDEEILQHIVFMPVEILNRPDIAGSNPNLVSVNACLMADLTGQICSENINGRQISGVGGQLDFVRAAAISEGGRSFLCMKSTFTDSDGVEQSNIRAKLPAGAVITTPRTDVMNVVTEWGIAQLQDRPFKERARAMIKIAHPKFRRQLAEEAVELGLLRSGQAEDESLYEAED